MPKYIRNRLIVLAVLTLAGLFCVAPIMTRNLPGWWTKLLPAEGMRLGLDLQGGMQLILKVDIPQCRAEPPRRGGGRPAGDAPQKADCIPFS